MSKAGKQEKVIKLVREFLELNEMRSKKKLSQAQIKKWFQLKQQIEFELFSRPPSELDLRQSIRLNDLKLPVHFLHGGDQCEGFVREISDGGLFVSTKDPLPTGAHLDLIVDCSEEDVDEIRLPAQVVYTNPAHSFSDRGFSGMGMAIPQDLDAKTQEKWRNLVGKLLQKAAQNAP